MIFLSRCTSSSNNTTQNNIGDEEKVCEKFDNSQEANINGEEDSTLQKRENALGFESKL